MEKTADNNSRLVLLLIAGLPVTMILAATWLWYFVVKGDLDIVGALGTANHGTLVQPPRQLAKAGLSEQAELPFDFRALEPKWTLLAPNQGDQCDAACEHLLYVTRQIHIAMGKEYNRIQRFYVSDVPSAGTGLAVTTLSNGRPLPRDFDDYLETEQRGLIPLVAEAPVFEGLFAEHLTAPDTWYLVDPMGWIMMSYDDSVSYKDVIADLKFLLKNSGD